MVRWVLASWLSLWVAIGPGLCCCAFTTPKGAAQESAASPACASCCCEPTPDHEKADPGPPAPHRENDCPCKQGGTKDFLPHSPSLQPLEVAVAWLSSADLHTAAWIFSDDALRSSKLIAVGNARERGFRALALCPILRC